MDSSNISDDLNFSKLETLYLKSINVSFEEIKPSQREHVLAMGVTRRISDSVRTQGIGVICFAVAIRQETAYVTGCLL